MTTPHVLSSASTTAPGAPAPVAPSERIESLDVVRGFALLGILLLNILAFGLPVAAYINPAVDGATTGVNYGVYATVELFFEGALRGLFSMLFGAGVVIFATGKSRGLYFRRQFLLLAFGLVNAFVFLFYGDILVPYAIAGMILYLARNWSVRKLLIGSGVVFTYLMLMYGSVFLIFAALPGEVEKIRAALEAGETITTEQQEILDGWAELEGGLQLPEDMQEQEEIVHGGTYVESFVANADMVVDLIYVQALPLMYIWDALACMMLGMALFKAGVFQGQRSRRFYMLLAVFGFAVGLAVNYFEVSAKTASNFDLQWTYGLPAPTNDIGRVAMAMGYLGILVLICNAGILSAARRGLAAVGRMALTNYMMHSVIALVIFHEMGFGLWNELQRYQLYFIVVVIWVVQIAFSLWWLGRYRFGPLEWLWRSATYGSHQSLVKE